MPDSIAAVGAMRRSWLLRCLAWLERRRYAAATRVATVGRGYPQELEARGVPAERISVIPNRVDRGMFDPAADAAQRRAMGRRDVVFLLVGDGGVREDLGHR